jgi:hypothetical protein
VTLATRRFESYRAPEDTERVERLGLGRAGGGALLALFLCAYVFCSSVMRRMRHRPLELFGLFAAFFSTGSIVFDGGQVGMQDRHGRTMHWSLL